MDEDFDGRVTLNLSAAEATAVLHLCTMPEAATGVSRKRVDAIIAKLVNQRAYTG